MPRPSSALTIDQLSFIFPGAAAPLFDQASLRVSLGKVGLIGDNGAGKSTLLSLLAGSALPYRGSIRCPAPVLYLPQNVPEGMTSPWDVLGREAQAELMRRCAAGEANAAEVLAFAEQWDDWMRGLTQAAAFGFDEASLWRPLASFSPGQRQRLLLLKAVLADPMVLLMDEPSNHLDEEGRQQLLELVASWDKGLVVASHDRELLEAMDAIVVITDRQFSLFGGAFSAYEEARQQGLAKREQDWRTANEAYRQAKRQQQQAMERQQKRTQRMAAKGDKLGLPKILIGRRKENAENSGAKLADKHQGKVAAAWEKRQEAQIAMGRKPKVRVDMPAGEAVSRRQILSFSEVNLHFASAARALWPEPLHWTVRGGERWLITGANGVGKSSVLKLAMGVLNPTQGQVHRYAKRPSLYLDQELLLLPRTGRVWEAARQLADPNLAESDIRLRLARIGFPGDKAFADLSSLSGGERMRLAMAVLFATSEPSDLLIMDEPTNHLDLASIHELEAALHDYTGAVLVVSHDPRFQQACRLSHRLALPDMLVTVEAGEDDVG